MWNARLEEAQAGIKIAGKNINNLRYADDTSLMAESEELKSLLMKVKEKSEKVGLNSTFRKLRSWHPVPSLHRNNIEPTRVWEIIEIARDFIFLGSKITADGECRHEIKRGLLLGRKVMTNLESILKSRDVTLPTKVCLVKAMVVFPVVMYGRESWTINSSEGRRIDAFELWFEDSWESLGLQGDSTSQS